MTKKISFEDSSTKPFFDEADLQRKDGGSDNKTRLINQPSSGGGQAEGTRPLGDAGGAAAPDPAPAPAPAADDGGSKTRVIRPGAKSAPADDAPAAAPAAAASTGAAQGSEDAPVTGWLVVIKGPGRGASVPLTYGMNQLGRGEANTARIDFGDGSISREEHAFIAYDDEERTFYVGHGGKANLVRLNGKPLLSTEVMENGAELRIGETTLRFVALCGPDFDWASEDG